ncbi:MAG: GNAT family N-acetyltransferase [Chloroflexi bacterium]|nr:GNAT family N-acetyltransferase [Chloroflexota bacterium]
MQIVNLHDHPEWLPEVAHWIYTEFIETLRPALTRAAVVEALQGRQAQTLPLTYVGVVDGACVATVSLVGSDLAVRPEWGPWLASLYVLPAMRGRGCARQLIDHVRAVAAGLGHTTLYLRTETAAAYYRRLGWRQIDALTDEFQLFTEVFACDLG